MCRTSAPRPSSTAPPAASSRPAGRSSRSRPWGRRRLAYPIGHHREGSYHIVLFESPAEAISELEHSLLITEEVLRHLVTRDDRPVKASRRDGAADDDDGDIDIDAGPPSEDEEDEDDTELIDESESEAAPAAID